METSNGGRGEVYALLLFLLVDIQSNNKVEKDNDPSSDTDHETQTHHFISIGGI